MDIGDPQLPGPPYENAAAAAAPFQNEQSGGSYGYKILFTKL